MSKRKLIIDSSKGGNGDIWMRLVSFYTVAGILNDFEIHLLIPPFLRKLAHYTFGDRLLIIDEEKANEVQLSYTNLGIVDLMKGIVFGKRYISPYQRAVIHDKANITIKDSVNVALFTVADIFGLVQIPKWKWINVYQGYLDIIAIKKLRKINYEQYLNQLESDYKIIFSKLNGHLPISDELFLPNDLNSNVLIFPTGTSRQFIPIWWAKKNLPDAYYAFFYKDKEADLFKSAGLKVLFFFKEAGDIIALSSSSKWTISTDSFPSHLLQYATNKCSITITEVLKSRIISPIFKGRIINSKVECHPCLHLDRQNHPYCAAGFTECQNWKSDAYSMDLINSINS